jgi:hypothetical protein
MLTEERHRVGREGDRAAGQASLRLAEDDPLTRDPLRRLLDVDRRRLEASGEHGWAITAAFYAAVHNCLLIRDTLYTSDLDHHDTKEYLGARAVVIAESYNIIFGKGWRARYEADWTASEGDYKKVRKHP